MHQLLSNALRMLCEILQNTQKHKSITGSTDRRTGQNEDEGAGNRERHQSKACSRLNECRDNRKWPALQG